MTLPLPLRDDFPRAAHKLLTDAELLHAAKRYDDAGYMAGYVVECVLKEAVRLEGDVPQKFGHNINRLSARVLPLVVASTSRTASYFSNPITTMSYGSPDGWDERLRYSREGTVPAAMAKVWVDEARRLYDTAIVNMRKDGVIPI